MTDPMKKKAYRKLGIKGGIFEISFDQQVSWQLLLQAYLRIRDQVEGRVRRSI